MPCAKFVPQMDPFEGKILEDSARAGPWVRLKGFYQPAASAGMALRWACPQLDYDLLLPYITESEWLDSFV